MAAIIQNIELPKKPRALDTSSSYQAISQELYTEANAASISNEANATTGWVGNASITPTSESSQQDSGSYAMKYTANANNAGMYLDLDNYCTVGKLYEISVYGKHMNDGTNDPENGDPNKHYVRMSSVSALGAGNSTTVNLTNPTTGRDVFQKGVSTDIVYSQRFRRFTHSADTRYFGCRESGNTNDGSMMIDTLSIKEVETFPNNNHGKIYSGRALEFDGVSDHLTTGYGSGLNPYTTPITAAFWAKGINSNMSNDIVFGSNNGDPAVQRMYVGIINKKWGIGIQNSDWTSSTNEIAGFADQPDANVDTWYRVVLVMNAGEAFLYVNGVKSYGKTYTSYALASDITISGNNDTTYAWHGLISDVQFWDAAWSADDIAYDYANPESLALNASGTALTEGNLKLWYPMQDGHRGQQSYILDGANSGLGEELVANGTFDNDISSWTNYAPSTTIETYDNGGLKIVASEGHGRMTQEVTGLKSGVLYKFSFDVVESSGNNFTHLGNSSGGSDIAANLGQGGGVGTFTLNFTSTQTTAHIQLGAVSGQTVVYDNVSIKPINDKHHATTVFLGDEQISATNDRTFAGASNWANAGGGNAFSTFTDPYTTADAHEDSLRLVQSPGSGSVKYAVLDGANWEDADGDGPAMVVGRTYRLSYSISIPTISGTISVGLANTSHALQNYNTHTSTASGYVTHAVDFVYSGTTTHAEMIVHIAAMTVVDVYFDNFSLKEVGVASGWTDADQQLDIAQPALQSYNEMAWFGGFDNCHAELNASIDTGSNNWSLSFWLYEQENATAYSWPIGTGHTQSILTKYDNGRTLRFRDDSGTYHLLSDGTITLGKWNHFAITAIGDTSMQAYINGVKQTLNPSVSDTTLVLLHFMEGYSGNHFPVGSITEIAYYNTVLADADVLDLYNNGKAKSALDASGSGGLVNYWRNNGLSVWTDLKASTYITPNALVTETLLCPQGVDGSRDTQGFIMNKPRNTSSLNLTNAGRYDGYVDLGSTTIVADDAAASFVVWLKPDDTAADNYFLGTGSTDFIKLNSATAIVLNANSNLAAVGGDNFFDVTTNSGPSITAGEWMHVAITRKSDDTFRLYTNGVLRETSSALNHPFDFRYIGARNHAEYTFRGQLDGFLYYNDELDDTEVLRNYKATKGSHTN